MSTDAHQPDAAAHFVDSDDFDDVADCVSCDGIAEVGDECWECHDGWRYISIPADLT